MWCLSLGAELRLWEILCLRFHLLLRPTQLCGWHVGSGWETGSQGLCRPGWGLLPLARGHTPTWARESQGVQLWAPRPALRLCGLITLEKPRLGTAPKGFSQHGKILVSWPPSADSAETEWEIHLLTPPVSRRLWAAGQSSQPEAWLQSLLHRDHSWSGPAP